MGRKLAKYIVSVENDVPGAKLEITEEDLEKTKRGKGTPAKPAKARKTNGKKANKPLPENEMDENEEEETSPGQSESVKACLPAMAIAAKEGLPAVAVAAKVGPTRSNRVKPICRESPILSDVLADSPKWWPHFWHRFRRRDADGCDRDGRAPSKVANDWGGNRLIWYSVGKGVNP